MAVAQAAIPKERSIDLLETASASLSVQSGKHIRFMTGPYQFLILLHGTRHTPQLRDGKVLQQAGFWVNRPIERADPTLTVAGIDPVNQLLITELIVITLAMVNVSAIGFAMP